MMAAWADYLNDRDTWQSVVNPEAALPSICGDARDVRFRIDEESGRLLEARGYRDTAHGVRAMTVKYRKGGKWTVTFASVPARGSLAKRVA